MSAVTGDVRLGAYTLRFNTRALVNLEGALGKSIQSAFADPGVGVIVKAVEVGAGISEAQAYELIDGVGVAKAGEAVAEAVKAAFPESDGKGPPKAA